MFSFTFFLSLIKTHSLLYSPKYKKYSLKLTPNTMKTQKQNKKATTAIFLFSKGFWYKKSYLYIMVLVKQKNNVSICMYAHTICSTPNYTTQKPHMYVHKQYCLTLLVLFLTAILVGHLFYCLHSVHNSFFFFVFVLSLTYAL